MLNRISKTKQNTPRNLKTTKILRTELSLDSSINTFLDETNRNSDIDDSVRIEIEERFQRSRINSTYKFPRTNQSKQLPKLKLSSKKRLKTPASILKKLRVYKQVVFPTKPQHKSNFFKTVSPKGLSINLKNLVSNNLDTFSSRKIKKAPKSARASNKISSVRM